MSPLVSGAVQASDYIRLSKKPSPELAKTKIDDLPDDLLVEILCRLPCSKFISRCKCVSKRWGTVMSDLFFIGCFLRYLSGQKQTPEMQTLLNCQGEEFLTRMSSSLKPLHQLYTKLMSFHHLKEEPVVVGTFNDLVLCCATKKFQRDYYICNPITRQLVWLPPPPQVFKSTLVGFICDLPYYNCKKDNNGGHVIHLNGQYNCKVVRLICPEDQRRLLSDKLKVQIFSSDTGEWIEFLLSSPSEFRFSDMEGHGGFACNGKLYWMGGDGDDQFVIGLDPFVIDSTTGSTSFSYVCDFLTIDKSEDYIFQCLGVSEGCLKLASYDFETTLYACDVNVDQMVRVHGERVGKLSKDMVNIYSLDEDMAADYEPMYDLDMLAFDPSDENVVFLLMNKDIIICNIRTREWSKIDDRMCQIHHPHVFFPLALPCWPTPVPRFPKTQTFQDL